MMLKLSILSFFITTHSLLACESLDGFFNFCHNVSIRIAATNVSSGNSQKYEDAHGIKLLNTIKADVILLQEFRYGANPQSEESVAEMISKLSIKYNVYREPMPQGDFIPNGILSKFPILAAGQIEDPGIGNRNRSFVWARIDIPGNKDLWAFSLHLKAGKKSKDPQTRDAQSQNLLKIVQEYKFVTPENPDGAIIPEADYVVMGGDFNTANLKEKVFQNLLPYFPIPLQDDGSLDPSYFPKDQNGNINTNYNRGSHYDQVLADKDLSVLEGSITVADQQFPHGFVLDCRVETTDENFKLETSVCDTTNMQHMPVLRDFLIPVE